MRPLVAGFSAELAKLAAAPGTMMNIPKQPMWSPPKPQQKQWQPSPRYSPSKPALPKPASSGRGRSAGGSKVPQMLARPPRLSPGRAFTRVNERFSNIAPPKPIPAAVKSSPTTARGTPSRVINRNINDSIGSAAWGGA